MRLDKYLKVSRLIKRRPVANEACDAGRIIVNGKVAKASLNVKVGDVIEISFGDKKVKVEVLSVEETYKKDEAKELYKMLWEQENLICYWAMARNKVYVINKTTSSYTEVVAK